MGIINNNYPIQEERKDLESTPESEFDKLVRPVMEYLEECGDIHSTIIITATKAEAFIGIKGVNR